MSEYTFEQTVRQHAIYSHQTQIEPAPINQILNNYKLETLGNGLLSRVYHVKNTDWVIKEGRWDIHLSLFGKSFLSGDDAEDILAPSDYRFLPKPNRLLEEYKNYLTFTEFFGFFDKEETFFHPKRTQILSKQKHIRASLSKLVPFIEKKYLFTVNPHVYRILNSDLQYYNFLPKEYFLFGQSFHPKNNNKETYFIVQKLIKGTLLHDSKMKRLSSETCSKLALFYYLVLVMHFQANLLPDTRPRHKHEVLNWATKTDNIMISEQNIIFIDTRWFWKTNHNFLKRGMLIPELIIQSAKLTLNKLLSHV